jgi:segregation and condensation protein B
LQPTAGGRYCIERWKIGKHADLSATSKGFPMARHPLAAARPVPLARPQRPVDRPRAAGAWAWALAEDESVEAGALVREPAVALVEAALLGADEPLSARRLAALARLAGATEARQVVAKLQALYVEGGSAFLLEELAGGYQLLTRPGLHAWVARLRAAGSEAQLTPAARETLAVVAYRQPVTRADVEAVRGVGCGEVLRQLLDKKLVRVAGREETLGRPQLYATTPKFLQVFGLRSLRDLPEAEGLAASKRAPERADEGDGAD